MLCCLWTDLPVDYVLSSCILSSFLHYSIISSHYLVQCHCTTRSEGLHNGHTVLGGEWQSVPLGEDRDDRDVLLTKEQVLVVNGYVPHELVALAIVLEYEVGIPVPQRTSHNAQTILNSTSVGDKVSTVVTLGVTIYVPFNGEKVLLRNGEKNDRRGGNDDDEELGVELPLRTDDVCTILTPKPLFTNLASNETGKGKRKTVGASKKADLKSRSRDNDDSDAVDDTDKKALSAIKVAFDLSVFDAARGEIVTDHEWTPTLAPEDDTDRDRDRDRDREGPGDRGYGDTLTSLRSLDMRSLKPYKESTLSSRRGISLSASQRKKSLTSDGYESDGAFSVSESIVGGDSEASNLVLDPLLYSGRHNIAPLSGDKEGRDRDYEGSRRGDRYGGEESEQQKSRFNVPKDRQSLLAQTMQARLTTGAGGSSKGRSKRESNDVLEDNEGEYQQSASRITAGQGVKMRSGVTLVSSSGVNHARELSRGARSRLGRHGFDGTIMDSNTQHDGRLAAAFGGHSRGVQPVDTALEARDVLALHDISIQFAGYRIGPATADSDKSSLSYPHPRSVYFSYQFYSCQPTRTEVSRLLSSDKGQLSVLCRDDAHARDDAPLALRYLIDCSDASPNEGHDFAEYMAKHSLFVDIWDADSLLLIGTSSIPLRKIMRQGQPLAKCAMECDVIDVETTARAVGGITTSVIQEGGVGMGCVVGALQVIMSNKGEHGKNKGKSLDRNGRSTAPATEGLNWRAHQHLAITPHGEKGRNHRPKVSVRARPLSENAPELSQALLDHRGDDRGRSMRSLTSARGQEDGRTLTYDDVAILFKRFQGSVKGTVQYSGAVRSVQL